MKREALAVLGITKKETVDKIMAMHGADIEKKKSEIVAAARDRDNCRQQLETVRSQLQNYYEAKEKEFCRQIMQLQADLEGKEKLYQAQLAQQAFLALVAEQAMAAKCKNPKALMALLELEPLKSSQNQKADIASAIQALQKSDGYLFEAVKGTGAQRNGCCRYQKAACPMKRACL